MLSFKTYMSDRSQLIKLGETARELACKTNDPVGFILNFAEERYPSLYEPLLEAFYMEGPTDGTDGLDTPAPEAEKGSAAKGTAPGARPATEVPHGGILDWLKDLFGGGGAAKNFDKALKSITKVDSVVKTIRIPDDLQEDPNSGVQGYNGFRDELTELLGTMQELSKKSRLLQVADAIKRDPNYVQELQGELAGSMGDPDLAVEEPEAPPADPDAEKKPADATPATDPTVKPDVLAKYKAEFEAGRFNTFDGATLPAATAAYEPIKKMPDGPDKDKAIAKFMHDHKHKGISESRRSKRVVESVFSEALVLAGVPTRRNK